MTGLVPQNLADILSTLGCEDEKSKRRMFKAQFLTEQEFYRTLKDKEENDRKMEEEKEQTRVAREQKRKEKVAQQKKRIESC